MPRPGWIGLTQISGNVGFAIRVGQFLNKIGWKFWRWSALWLLSGFEHVFVWTGALDTKDGIIEAEPGGARHVPFHYDMSKVKWVQPPDDATGVKTALAAIALKGIPYSFLDYLALALMRLHIPSRLLRRYVASLGHMICSQLADHAAAVADWHLFPGHAEGDVTPEDFAALVP